MIPKIMAGDMQFDAVGRPLTVTDREKLAQLVEQVLLQEADHRGFGAGLGRTGFDITTEIHEAFTRWRSLQDKSAYIRGKEEQLQEIASLDILERKGTKVRFRLIVKSKAGLETAMEGQI